MILIVFFIAGLVIGMLRGGGLSGLVRLRGIWLILISVVAERAFVYLPLVAPQLFPDMTAALQLVRFVPLFLFALLNIRDWRVCIAGLGIAMNFAVIAANHWQMPISATVLPQQDIVAKMPEYFIMQSAGGAVLWFLSDIIHVYGLIYLSAGDILLGIGVLLAIQHNMARYSSGRHVRGSHAERSAGGAAHSRRGRRPEAPPESEPAFGAPQPEPPAAAPAEPKRSEAAVPARTVPRPEQSVSEAPFSSEPKPEQRAPASQAAPKPEPPKAPKSEPIPGRPAMAPKAERQPAGPEAPVPPRAEKQPADLQLLRTVPGERFELEADGEGGGKRGPVKLSPRLETVARMAERGVIVADIGCDHGKLSAWLALNGTPMVIATDISSKSLAKTKQLVKELGLQRAVQTRAGDGLRKLKPGEADVIVMAGMGGPTICGILEEGRGVAESAARLVLQPMNAVGTVRKWLTDNGFCITDERLAEEDGRIYQILAAVPGTDGTPPMSLFDLEVGHILVDCRHPLLPKLLVTKIDTIDTILSEIAGNATPRAEARRSELIELRERCSQVLEWIAG